MQRCMLAAGAHALNYFTLTQPHVADSRHQALDNAQPDVAVLKMTLGSLVTNLTHS